MSSRGGMAGMREWGGKIVQGVEVWKYARSCLPCKVPQSDLNVSGNIRTKQGLETSEQRKRNQRGEDTFRML